MLRWLSSDLIVFAIFAVIVETLPTQENVQDFHWKQLQTESRGFAANGPHPRYSSAMAALGKDEGVILTHGYYYEEGQHWLDDTWVHLQGSWQKVKFFADSPKPVPRFGHSLNSLTGKHSKSLSNKQYQIILFGGDDGSFSRSPKNYLPNYFNDTWLLTGDSKGWSWQELHAGQAPDVRTGHCSFVHDDCLYIFAGHDGPKNDMWKMCFRGPLRWEKVIYEHDEYVPPGRYQTSMVLHKDTAYVYGGFHIPKKNLADLWSFHVPTKSWTMITGEVAHSPGPRGGFSLAILGETMVLWGGATCQGMCKCHSDLWTWRLDGNNTWREVETARQLIGPPPRYKQSTVVVGNAMWMFGGEGYRFAQDYHSDLWRVVPPPPPLEEHEHGWARADVIVVLGIMIIAVVYSAVQAFGVFRVWMLKWQLRNKATSRRL